MNALDMLGGYTASAGPIGGAEASGAAEAAAGDSAGGFDSLVAKALGANPDEDVVLAQSDDDDADPAEPGLDLSVMLAMAGLTPFQVTTPVNEPAAPAAGDGNAAGSGVGVMLETLPCTLVPAGDLAASAVAENPAAGQTTAVAAEAFADLTDAADASTPTPIAATPTKGDAAIPSKDAGPQDAAVSTTLATGAPSDPSDAVEAPKADVAPAAPTAGPAHQALRAKLARAGRTDAAQTPHLDEAWRQAASELRGALAGPAGTESASPARPAVQPTGQAPVVSRQAEGPTTAATSEPDSNLNVAIAASAGGAASSDTSSQSGSFGSRSGSGNADEQSRGAVVSVTGARAEAAIHAFSSLAAEATGAKGAPVETPAAVPTDAPAVTPQESAHNVRSMVRAMRLHFTDGGGEARLQLNPEHLGQVTLTVKVEQGKVAAHIQAETADASRWIESHQSNLRSALEEQGLDVKELVVSTDPDGRGQRDQAPDQQSKARPQRRTASGETPKFEILV